jgi:phenylacetic acid degradation operon negative regulatory protein
MRLVSPSPKSLILDLLSTLPSAPGSSMPVRALVEAGAIFGLAENSLRVALARLFAQGRVERDERGRYRMGADVAPLGDEIRAWRRLEARIGRWSGTWVGTWVGVDDATSRRRGARARSEQALRFLGFRSLVDGFSVRPDNLAGGVAAVRERLSRLGLAPGSLVVGVSDLDPSSDARARRLWDPAQLAVAQRAGCDELVESRRRLATASEQQAMAETFLVGGKMIRLLVLDPLLPREIAPTEAREALVEAMVAYDDFGRACWSDFMARHGAPHRVTPVDLRLVEGAGGAHRGTGFERSERAVGR